MKLEKCKIINYDIYQVLVEIEALNHCFKTYFGRNEQHLSHNDFHQL